MPADSCVNGFSPEADKLVNLKEKCSEGDKSVIFNEVDQHYIENVSVFFMKISYINNELTVKVLLLICNIYCVYKLKMENLIIILHRCAPHINRCGSN